MKLDPAMVRRLTLYGELIKARRGEPALEAGRFELVGTEGDMLACLRRHGQSAFLVAHTGLATLLRAAL